MSRRGRSAVDQLGLPYRQLGVYAVSISCHDLTPFLIVSLASRPVHRQPQQTASFQPHECVFREDKDHSR